MTINQVPLTPARWRRLAPALRAELRQVLGRTRAIRGPDPASPGPMWGQGGGAAEAPEGSSAATIVSIFWDLAGFPRARGRRGMGVPTLSSQGSWEKRTIGTTLAPRGSDG